MVAVVQSALNTVVVGAICCLSVSLYTFQRLRGANGKTKEQIATEKNDQRPKVVVITGCDTGFGHLMAQAWSRGNQDNNNRIVVALTLTESSAREFNTCHGEEKQKHGGSSDGDKIVAIKCDVTSTEDVRGAKHKIEELLTERNAVLYAIVNNAGIADPGDFVFYSNDDDEINLTIPKRVMEVNYFGQLAVTQALLPLMLTTSEVAGGKIFNMSSVCGTNASVGNSAYCASKFAIEAWSDALRLELEPFNIQVTKIRPGQTNTQMQQRWKDNFIQNFTSASEQILNLYGRGSYVEKFNQASQNMADGSSFTPPSVLVDTITEALVQSSKLKPYYWVGNDAHTLWKAFTILPASVTEMIKKLTKVAPVRPNLPPPNTVAHVTIRVRDMETSLEFYKAMGFEPIGPREGEHQFLQFNPSNNGTWESLILLKEDKAMPRRGKCTDAGMTRLCILTENVEQDYEELKSRHGLEPMGPLAFDKGTGIKEYVYHDPDEFVVYRVQIPSFFLKLMLWWNKKKFPFAFHWSINVTDYKHANTFFEKFGFKTMSDQNKDQVLNNLLKGFNLDPISTVIKWIRLCYLPKGGIVATIMEWVTPQSVVNESSTSNSMTLCVTDVKAELEKARRAGLIVENDSPSYEKLPIYGNVLVGKAYLEKDNCPIEFCCFSNQKP